jgi:hypothetical protein
MGDVMSSESVEKNVAFLTWMRELAEKEHKNVTRLTSMSEWVEK